MEPGGLTVATWTVTIPGWTPHRANQLVGCHRGTRGRRKRLDRQMVAAYAAQAGVPPAARPRRVGLTITLGPGQRGGDVDAYWKSLLDALKAARLIRDDSHQWCELLPVRFERGPQRAAAVTLEDL